MIIPLTPRGRAPFRLAAQGLARIVDRPDALRDLT